MVESLAVRVEPNAWVTVRYVLRSAGGEVLDDGTRPLEYVHGYGMVVPGLEARLAGLAPGDARTARLEPQEAFGVRDERLVHEVGRSELPAGAKVGDELVLEKSGETLNMRIAAIDGEQARLDANHPLAGQEVVYEVEVLAVRPATPDEVRAAAQAVADVGEEDQDDGAGPCGLIHLGRKG